MGWIQLSIDVTPVSDLDHRNDKPALFNFIKDPIIPLSKPVAVLARELLGSRWPRIFSELRDALEDADLILPGQRLEIFLNGLSELDPIHPHQDPSA